MKQLMIDVVDRTYQFLHTIFDEHAGRAWLARQTRSRSGVERTPLPSDPPRTDLRRR